MSRDGEERAVAGSVVGWATRLNLLWFSALMGLATVVSRLPVAAAYTIPAKMAHLDLVDGLQIPPIVVGFLIMPIIETGLGQWLPVQAAYSLGLGRMSRLLVSALVFSSLHLSNLTGAVTAFLPGLVLAYTYMTWRNRSRSQAFWVTVLAHVWEIGFVSALRLL